MSQPKSIDRKLFTFAGALSRFSRTHGASLCRVRSRDGEKKRLRAKRENRRHWHTRIGVLDYWENDPSLFFYRFFRSPVFAICSTETSETSSCPNQEPMLRAERERKGVDGLLDESRPPYGRHGSLSRAKFTIRADELGCGI